MPAAARAETNALVPLLTVNACLTPSCLVSAFSKRVVKPRSPPRYRSNCPLAITRPRVNNSVTPTRGMRLPLFGFRLIRIGYCFSVAFQHEVHAWVPFLMTSAPQVRFGGEKIGVDFGSKTMMRYEESRLHMRFQVMREARLSNPT